MPAITNATFFYTKKGKPVELPEPMAPLADTHGHLTPLRHRSPAEAVARAALAGVRLLAVPVDPADDVPDVEEFLAWFSSVREEAATILREAQAPEACELLDNLYFMAGIHPYGAKAFMEDPSIRRRLEQLLDDPRCVCMGEFGLDVGPWSELTLEEQLPAMRTQLRMAHERGLAVELHLRDGQDDLATAAHDEALALLRAEGVPPRGCDLHCYTSGPEVLGPFVELGCHIAFGGASTFARSDQIREAACLCPEHLLLSETDSPYMAPVPLRGLECEPAMVALTVRNLALVREERGIAPLQQTYEALWRNARAFLGLD